MKPMLFVLTLILSAGTLTQAALALQPVKTLSCQLQSGITGLSFSAQLGLKGVDQAAISEFVCLRYSCKQPSAAQLTCTGNTPNALHCTGNWMPEGKPVEVITSQDDSGKISATVSEWGWTLPCEIN